jgi:Putative auto-transporter adhesin, head GIN domain
MRHLAGALLTVPLILAGCLTGEGPVVSETRDVRAFDRIEVGAGIRVAMRIGPAEALEVRAQSNLLDAIATDVTGSTLTIDARGSFTSAEAVTVVVVAPALEAIALSGGAQATIEGLEAASIEIAANGGSHATLVGTAERVELKCNGGSSAELGDLVARTITTTLAGGATATVNASGEVTGSASGGSHLTVRGDADVAVETSGGAEVAGN